jgi:uncharacterized membrane protein YsdA (DUF1294 family)
LNTGANEIIRTETRVFLIELVKILDFEIFLVIYAILNGIVFCVYAYDRRKAKRNSRRTSEKRLLILALIGPIGAYCAMNIFRHKTLKTKFLLVPLFLVMHLAVIFYLISTLV